MPVVDASVLVALFNVQDPHHERARDLAEAPTAWRVPTVALVELSQVARRMADTTDRERDARRAAAATWALPFAQEETSYDVDAARALYERRRTLSYADAIIIATAWHHGDTLLTFDKRQERAWKKGPS